MRALTESETQTLFRKLADYTGRSLTHLISPPDANNERYVFRISGSPGRVYYVKESIANLATSIPRSQLLSLGTCLGKFTKSGKALSLSASKSKVLYARVRVCVKADWDARTI